MHIHADERQTIETSLWNISERPRELIIYFSGELQLWRELLDYHLEQKIV